MLSAVERSPVVRPTSDADLAAVGRLFTPAKSPELLRWLLADPDDPTSIRSWVATLDDEVVGHVGYTRSSFTDGRRMMTGVYPVVWKVREGARGGVGLQLLSRVFDHGDFSFIIGGSAQARKLYRVLGYKLLFHVPTYRKTRNLRGLGLRLFSRAGARVVKLRSQSIVGNVLARSQSSKLQTAATPQSAVFANHATASILNWAAACPEVETRLVRVSTRPDEDLQAVVYVRRPTRGPVAGTIVYLPYLGDEVDRWRRVLQCAETVLAESGCSHITVMACDPTLRDALSTCGFALDKQLPFWFRGRSAPPSAWHLTYLEGDLGYRK